MTKKGEEAKVQIVHDYVGTYHKGAIVSASAFGTELPRLMELGAVREYDTEEPWADDPTQTLQEAIHSSSPPTLPNAPYVDATREDVLAVMGDVPADTLITTARTNPEPDVRHVPSAEKTAD